MDVPTAEKRAFIDTNVLSDIVISEEPARLHVLRTLTEHAFTPVTYAKCICELYSIVKGTTKEGDKNNHPLRRLGGDKLNDISQRLFRRWDDIDPQGNGYYWFTLCEEWADGSYFDEMPALIEKYVPQDEQERAAEFRAMQHAFVQWRERVSAVIDLVDERVERAGIRVLEPHEVFAHSPIGMEADPGMRDLARRSLLPNEDYDLVFAAVQLGAQIFVTNDRKGLAIRGAASLSLNGPHLCFCHPSMISLAAEDGFARRWYVPPAA